MDALRIPKEEHQNRTKIVLRLAQENGYDGVVLFRALNIHYFTGMYHLSTERICAIGVTEKQTKIVVPRLEKEHAERKSFAIDDVDVYFDYPQGDPMEQVKKYAKS